MVAEKEPTGFTVHLLVANRCVIKTAGETITFSRNVGAAGHIFHPTDYFKELSLRDFFLATVFENSLRQFDSCQSD